MKDLTVEVLNEILNNFIDIKNEIISDIEHCYYNDGLCEYIWQNNYSFKIRDIMIDVITKYKPNRINKTIMGDYWWNRTKRGINSRLHIINKIIDNIKELIEVKSESK